MQGFHYDPEMIRRIREGKNKEAIKKLQEALESAKNGDYAKAKEDMKEAVSLYGLVDTMHW